MFKRKFEPFFGSNEQNVWAYLFSFHRIPYRPKSPKTKTQARVMKLTELIALPARIPKIYIKLVGLP